ncbi:MAG: PTS sugar transporter subunit IIB [Streptococcaceae bacterium]|nr:PTS sugar transporter subunit IIB [Streptococcaceae bacterium]
MNKDVLLLVCAAGVSTNLMITQMRHLASIQRLQLDIISVSGNELDEAIHKYPVCAVLLSPQLRYMKNNVLPELNKMNIPIDVISMKDFGNLNSKNILKQALSLKT